MTHNSFKVFQLEHLLVFEFVNSCCRIYVFDKYLYFLGSRQALWVSLLVFVFLISCCRICVFDKYLYFLGRRQALWVSLAASEAEFQA